MLHSLPCLAVSKPSSELVAKLGPALLPSDHLTVSGKSPEVPKRHISQVLEFQCLCAAER